jgi:hypothetical protein
MIEFTFVGRCQSETEGELKNIEDGYYGTPKHPRHRNARVEPLDVPSWVNVEICNFVFNVNTIKQGLFSESTV